MSNFWSQNQQEEEESSRVRGNAFGSKRNKPRDNLQILSLNGTTEHAPNRIWQSVEVERERKLENRKLRILLVADSAMYRMLFL